MGRMTKHVGTRMSQRGITKEMVELASMFGDYDGDRLRLDRRALLVLLERIRAAERTTLKLLDKGGIVVVEEGEAVVTTYNVDSYDRRRAKSRTARRPRAYEGRRR
jgi:hypothetical protein